MKLSKTQSSDLINKLSSTHIFCVKEKCYLFVTNISIFFEIDEPTYKILDYIRTNKSVENIHNSFERYNEELVEEIIDELLILINNTESKESEELGLNDDCKSNVKCSSTNGCKKFTRLSLNWNYDDLNDGSFKSNYLESLITFFNKNVNNNHSDFFLNIESVRFNNDSQFIELIDLFHGLCKCNGVHLTIYCNPVSLLSLQGFKHRDVHFIPLIRAKEYEQYIGNKEGSKLSEVLKLDQVQPPIFYLDEKLCYEKINEISKEIGVERNVYKFDDQFIRNRSDFLQNIQNFSEDYVEKITTNRINYVVVNFDEALNQIKHSKSETIEDLVISDLIIDEKGVITVPGLDEDYKSVIVGNIYEDFDLKKSKSFIENILSSHANCKECWVNKLCRIKHKLTNNTLANRENCEFTRRMYENFIHIFSGIYMLNPSYLYSEEYKTLKYNSGNYFVEFLNP